MGIDELHRHPSTDELLLPLICDWLSTAQEYEVSPENFMEKLADGIILCNMLAKIKETNLRPRDYYNPVSKKTEAQQNLDKFRKTCEEKLYIPCTFSNRDFNSKNKTKLIDVLLYLAKYCSSKRSLKSEIPKQLQQYLQENLDEIRAPGTIQLFNKKFKSILNLEDDDEYIQSVEEHFKDFDESDEEERYKKRGEQKTLDLALLFGLIAKSILEHSHIVVPTFLVGVATGFILRDSDYLGQQKIADQIRETDPKRAVVIGPTNQHYMLVAVIAGLTVHMLHTQNVYIQRRSRKR